MRVQLRISRQRRTQRGAIAVMTALFASLLLVITAFTLDFGLAYNSKRQLQTAADSAALAAVAVYAKYPGKCDASFVSAHEAEARAAAEEWASKNYPDQSLTWSTPTCVDGAPEVTVETEAATDQVLGALATGSDEITTSRSASALTDVPPTVSSGMRPLALCSAELPPGPYGESATEVRLDYPGGGHTPPSGCPIPKNPGNWWLLDCPGERTGSASELKKQIEEGCPDPVSVIDGQENAESPEQLTLLLEDACPDAPKGSETCLSGNPGNIDQGQVQQAWEYLINNGIQISMPVFCAPPICDESTVDGNGTGSVVPVFKLAGMQICGVHFAKNKKYARTVDPKAPCTAAQAQTVMNDNTDDNYLIIALTNVRSSGSTSDIGVCNVGEDCDGGLRRLVLSG